MRRFLFGLATAAGVGLVWLALELPLGDFGVAPHGVRSVLVVSLDTTRADLLRLDRPDGPLLPRLRALAGEGLRFPSVYTVAPLTLPAHASLLSGLYPPRHGIRENGYAALPPSIVTLPEVCRRAGFATAAFVSSAVLDRAFGLDQGFDVYDQPALGSREGGDFNLERPARETAERAASWLAEQAAAGSAFCLFTHFYDPHLPYAPGPDDLARAGGDPYRGEAVALDRAVGRLLDELERLGLADETLVVVTADHGESLGEHGEETHGALLYEATMRIPLIVRVPGAQRGDLPVAPLASLVDVAPTVLGRLGLEPPADLDGADLFSPALPAERGVYLESMSGYLHYGWSPLQGWVRGATKYLHSSQPELYRIDLDPGETQNLVGSRPELERELRGAIGAVFTQPAPQADLLPDEELRHALMALGYARAGDAPSVALPFEDATRPSPRAGAPELKLLHVSHALVVAERWPEAQAELARLLALNPRHTMGLELAGLALMHLERFEEALALFDRRLEVGPDQADLRLNIGTCFERLGQRERALAETRRALVLFPDHPACLQALERLQ